MSFFVILILELVELFQDSTLTIEAGSSSGVNGCCNNILATTVTFADDKVSVRYWPPVVINNETRISASSTTWRKELFSDSAEHEIEVPPCDDGKKQKLNDVDEQTTDTNSRCHINGISEENEVANGSDSCSGIITLIQIINCRPHLLSQILESFCFLRLEEEYWRIPFLDSTYLTL